MRAARRGQDGRNCGCPGSVHGPALLDHQRTSPQPAEDLRRRIARGHPMAVPGVNGLPIERGKEGGNGV